MVVLNIDRDNKKHWRVVNMLKLNNGQDFYKNGLYTFINSTKDKFSQSFDFCRLKRGSLFTEYSYKNGEVKERWIIFENRNSAELMYKASRLYWKLKYQNKHFEAGLGIIHIDKARS